MLSLLLLFAATSTQFEDLDTLDRNIQLYADAEPVDKRLKLAQCPNNPIIAPPAGGAVVVRCPAIGWRLRVPVRVAAVSDKLAQAVIRKGDMIACITNGPGFAISTQMIALDDAGIGESLRVKSLTSPVPMTVVAQGRGVAAF